jgi:DNA uptake protein ComE-like DNA-binding protein
METRLLPITKNRHKIVQAIDRYRWHLSGLLLLLIAGTTIFFMMPVHAKTPEDPGQKFTTSLPSETPAVTPDSQPSSGEMVIDVAGAVARPGVYHLAANSIVEDALSAAGGFSSIADIEYVYQRINRAEALTNHSKVYIPRIGQTVAQDFTAVTKSTSTSTSPAPASSTSSSSSGNTSSSSVININTADASSLEGSARDRTCVVCPDRSVPANERPL